MIHCWCSWMNVRFLGSTWLWWKRQRRVPLVIVVCVAAVPPGDEVVCVAVPGWTVADGEGAAAVADGEGGSEDAGEEALLASDVEWLAVAVADEGEDVGVAGEDTGLFGAELFAGFEQDGRLESVGEDSEVEEQVDAGSVNTIGRTLARRRVPADDLHQRVEPALIGRSHVTSGGAEVGTRSVGLRKGFDQCAEGFAVGDWSLAAEVHAAVPVGSEAQEFRPLSLALLPFEALSVFHLGDLGCDGADEAGGAAVEPLRVELVCEAEEGGFTGVYLFC